MKTYKAQELYVREYGNAAYEAWLAREKEINACMKNRGKFGVNCIVRLREESFRLMKIGCTQHDLNLDIWGNIVLRPRRLGIVSTQNRLAA